MSKPKMYFVCEDRGPEWFVCYGVLENGFCFGQHLCSHPGFAPGDLYFRRKQRVSALKEIFGHEWMPEEAETIIVRSIADKPAWWDAHGDLQEGLKDTYERYSAMLTELEGNQ